MKINSLDKDIHAILESSFYIIPRFQRPYSWDKDNILEFWQDSIVNNDDEYFIGALVVFKRKDKSYGIVDGQQRLTTITIMLSVLRNAYKENGFQENAKGLHGLIERNDINNEARYIIKTETSFPFFQEYIQKFDQPDLSSDIKTEEKVIQSAHKQINSLIKDAVLSISSDSTIDEENKEKRILSKLNSIRDKILNLKVIFIELDDENDAYLIFETLNTRGKDLAPSDLVKNLLSRNIKPINKDVDIVKIKWGKIVEVVENAPGEISVNNFLQHHWLANYDYTSNKKLYKQITQTIKKDQAKEYLNDLERQSKIYRYINEPRYKDWTNEEEKIKSSLEGLDIFNVRQPLPLILSIMNKYEKKKLSKKQTINILKTVENFIFKYTAIVTTQSTGGLSMMYSSYARKLTFAKNEGDINNVLTEIKNKLRELSPDFETFRLSFNKMQFSKRYTKERRLIKYILSKFHNELNKSNITDFSQMTIEHLLPQERMNKYKNAEETICSLGNLILVSKDLNGKLGDKDFEQKKIILKSHGCALDEHIDQSSKWHKPEINKRLEWMAKRSYDEFWRL
ncbi:DUF262 domain-containing HNH endonuclease family protein [Marispirochaeta aestuarii]|uniref:DUF262 domain-containing protein n=1 Tax=Marispirochaeta aestuarii TaxID=1963862 RepID=UPI0029C6B674|nr:DUF262 domain-containing HNH endonuclease family protein [Marispirochaeta aestuarii]